MVVLGDPQPRNVQEVNYLAHDEYGIPHGIMRCGAPNGYSFVQFSGTDYDIAFKASRRPASAQMSIYVPSSVKASETTATEVLVNVFAGSERSIVQMRVPQGPWIDMQRVNRVDPYISRIKFSEASPSPPNGRRLTEPRESPHLWSARLPELSEGTYVIEVRTRDAFGNAYQAKRILRVE